VGDLCRARVDLVEDRTRARHRLSKFLLRHGRVFWAGSAWTYAHERWLVTQSFDEPALAAAYGHYRAVLDARDAQLEAIGADLATWYDRPPFADQVARLAAYRGAGGGLQHLVADPDPDGAGQHDGELVLAGVVVGLDQRPGRDLDRRGRPGSRRSRCWSPCSRTGPGTALATGLGQAPPASVSGRGHEVLLWGVVMCAGRLWPPVCVFGLARRAEASWLPLTDIRPRPMPGSAGSPARSRWRWR
jgi:hypothetical protein